MGVSLRSCPQGRRASGYAHASVLRCASHRADARPSHASRGSFLMFYPVFIHALLYLV
ncbi:MAG: hypothetical protein NZ519_05580 [Bacteroidia bacterium]|nr:hypothetical protein [Bacteroidia bacterium]